MKKKISIINYILVIILAMIGCFKIYILNTNIEIKNILKDVTEFEYSLAILLFVPLVSQILMSYLGINTLEMKTNEQNIIPKEIIKRKKIVMDCAWHPIFSIILLLISILPILFSIVTEHFLIRTSTIIATAVYMVLILTSFLWLYYEIVNIIKDKKQAKKSIKNVVKNITLFLLVLVLIIGVPNLIITKVGENRKEKLMNYVLSDIQNPKESSKGYLDIEDIKTRIMDDYYPEDVYYSVVVDHKKDEISFVTYTDNSEDVSAYLYKKTKYGYKFKLKIAKSSISKEDIKKYDGIFENSNK